MSIESFISRSRTGDPRLTITVEGAHDMYRVAEQLCRSQCDIQPHGRKVFPYLVRFLGLDRFKAFDQSMNNGWAVKNGLHRRVRGEL